MRLKDHVDLIMTRRKYIKLKVLQNEAADTRTINKQKEEKINKMCNKTRLKKHVDNMNIKKNAAELRVNSQYKINKINYRNT